MADSLTESGARPSEPLVRVEELKKHFPVGGRLPFSRAQGLIRAVDGISFAIWPGETLALVGESGCGKTTTSRLMLLLEKPTAGVIYFEGRDIHELSRRQLKRYRSLVQAVFQDPFDSLDPRMRAGEIIAEPMVINEDLSRDELDGRVGRLLTQVGLDPSVADHFPHEFSGGQRQRVAVARALSLGSQLVILDEPVSALDVSIRAQVMNLLKDLQNELGMSYLLIAHDLGTVRHLSHEVAVMYLGQIVEQASSETLFTNPLHPYTNSLISSAPRAQLGDPQEEIILEGEIPSPAEPPPGCRFHTRCWLYEQLGKPENCVIDVPELREAEAGHRVACHWVEEISIGLSKKSTEL